MKPAEMATYVRNVGTAILVREDFHNKAFDSSIVQEICFNSKDQKLIFRSFSHTLKTNNRKVYYSMHWDCHINQLIPILEKYDIRFRHLTDEEKLAIL